MRALRTAVLLAGLLIAALAARADAVQGLPSLRQAAARGAADIIAATVPEDTASRRETIFGRDPGLATGLERDWARAREYVDTHVLDTTPTTSRNWWQLMKRGRLSMTDTTVEWPRFLKFCVDVYNWGNVAFNGTDTAWVVGTGKRWKARLVNDYWDDGYALNIDRRMSMLLTGRLYASLGAYLQYMAVSVGYSFDLTHALTNRPVNHKRLEFGFSCARFNAEIYYQDNTGGAYVRKFGHYNNGRLFRMEFPGVSMYKFGFNGYYIFNNKRYSYGAAYGFSKIQKKNAGSWMAGFTYTNLDVNLDMRRLNPQLMPYLTVPAENYKFHYRSYCLTGGYGYNFVLNKHLLLNLTLMPAVGLANCYEDSLEGTGSMLALSGVAMGSLTYNLGNFFICGIGRLSGNMYHSDRYEFWSPVGTASANIGIRF